MHDILPAMLEKKKIALIGAGNIAEALVSGMLKNGVVTPTQIYATDNNPTRLEIFKNQYHVHVSADNQKACAWGDIIILAVKPQVFDEVMSRLSLKNKRSYLIVSVIAGMPISRILNYFPSKMAIIRAMPNTPATVLEGATAIAGSPNLSEKDFQIGESIFRSVGKVVRVDETLMDTVTGLSGGGPAYIFVMIEALTDGGVKMGLSRSVAQLLAAQTVLGAAKMVLQSEVHPGLLKDQVASPGGTTIAGLHELEKGGVRSALMNAVQAASNRSKELGAQGTGSGKKRTQVQAKKGSPRDYIR